jgi:Predicted transcriptional regulator
MKTIEETYRERLLMLSKEYGGQTELSKRIDKSPAQISQWINGSADSKTGKARSMKSDTAREIEVALKLPRGWFDQPIDSIFNKQLKGFIQFTPIDVETVASNGFNNDNYSESVQLIEVSENWARENISNNLNSISIITAITDSMKPTFDKGDLLFVDEKVNYYASEGIYVVASSWGLKVKRLELSMNGELKIISDNKNYPVDILKDEEINLLKIYGKVVAALKIKNI